MQAAILNVKLKHLDKYIEARRKAATYYNKAFQNTQIVTPVEATYGKHVFHQYTIKVPHGRNELQKHLAEKKIPAMIYYPVPAHLQKAYSYYGFSKGDFPVTEKLCEQVISLPMHTELDEEQLNYIIENVLNFYK
jgi:dTDP-4-amino-4,6-dideoxygalactose transaminase